MNAKIIVMYLFCSLLGFVVGGAVDSKLRAGADSARLGEVKSELDRTVERLATEQRRSSELAEDVGAGLIALKTSLGDGTRSLAERIRSVATRVADMEDRLLEYRRIDVSNNSTISD